MSQYDQSIFQHYRNGKEIIYSSKGKKYETTISNAWTSKLRTTAFKKKHLMFKEQGN
jgi:hypothetical protein